MSGKQTKFITSREVDDPLVQDADYRFGPSDRKYIDDQIRGIQQYLVDEVVPGVFLDDDTTWRPPTATYQEGSVTVLKYRTTTDTTEVVLLEFDQPDQTSVDYTATVQGRGSAGERFKLNLTATYDSTLGTFTALAGPSSSDPLTNNPGTWTARFAQTGTKVQLLVQGSGTVRWVGQANALTVALTSTSSFDPSTIAALTLWLDATDLTQGGGIVTAMNNKASPSNDPTITAGQEPIYVASNPSYNGRPTWNCSNGTTKVVQAAPACHGLTTGPYTVVIVGQTTDVGNALGDPNGATRIIGGGGTGNKWQMSGDAGTYLASATGVDSSPSVAVFVFNGASSKVYVNSKTPDSGNGGVVADLSALTLMIGNYGVPSSTQGQDGPTTHFLIYNAALSQANVEYLLDGFGAQCGITINP